MISVTNTKLKTALEIASLGYRVVPVYGLIGGVCSCGETRDGNAHKPGKHPACPRGVNEATTDPETIKRWFENASWLNIGIAFDENVFAIDSDPKNGGDKTLQAWEAEHGPMPITPMVKSGSGGRHVYFNRPPGVVVKNRPVAPGIDTKTIGGYVIVPPSDHVSGGVYEWLIPLATPLADAPDWLLAIVSDPVKVAGVYDGVRSANPVNDPEDVSVDDGDCVDDDEFVMGTENDFESYPGVSEKRTETLWRLIGSHKRRGDDVETIEALALSWASRCTPPLDESKVRKHVHDLWHKPDAFSFSDNVDSDVGGGIEQSVIVEPCRMPYVGSPPEAVSVGGTIGGAFTYTFTETSNVNEPSTETSSSNVNDTTYDIRHTTTFANVNETTNENVNDTSTLTAYDIRHTTNDTSSLNPKPITTINDKREDTLNETITERDDKRPVDASENENVESIDPDAGDAPGIKPGGLNGNPVEDAYHGIVGDIVRAIEPETEADPMGVLVSLLVHVGNVIGRGAWTPVGTTRHHANLFAVLVGDTASGKGQAEDVCEYLMRLVDSEDDRLGSGLSSGEGLIERVRDHETEDDDESVTMQGEKRFIAIEAEFGRTITVARRDGNTLSPVMRDAWDGKTLSVMTRSRSSEKRPAKPLRASNAHVSVIGHITPTELKMAMAKASGLNEIANGFANRFLWVCVERSKLLPTGGDAGVLDPFTERLAASLAAAKKLGRITRTPEAEALWANVYGALTEAKPGSYGLVVSRGRAQVVRLALIYAALDGSRVVNENHLRAGLAVWRYCESSAVRIFGTPSPNVDSGLRLGDNDHLVIRLQNTISATPGIHRRDLRRTSRPETDADFDAGLSFLETHGMAYRKSVKTTGRDAEAWFPGTPPIGDDDEEKDMSSTHTVDESFTMGTDEPSPSTATCHMSEVGSIVNASATLSALCHVSYVGSVISPASDLRHMTSETEPDIDTSLEQDDMAMSDEEFFAELNAWAAIQGASDS